jgi:transposase
VWGSQGKILKVDVASGSAETLNVTVPVALQLAPTARTSSVNVTSGRTGDAFDVRVVYCASLLGTTRVAFTAVGRSYST